MGRPKSWQEMREWIKDLLVRKTGAGIEEWNARVADSGIDNEPDLRGWLEERGVEGYSQMLLVMERFGYPDFLTASADELVDGQYADRPELRGIYERLVSLGAGIGAGVQTRKTYVTLTTDRRKFALIKPSTKQRLDLGLRLEGQQPGGRLESAKVLGDEAMTVRIPLTSEDDVDDEVGELLARAYRANL